MLKQMNDKSIIMKIKDMRLMGLKHFFHYGTHPCSF